MDRRVLLKLSGEVLGGEDGVGLDAASVDRVVTEMVAALAQGVEIGVVVGGGNFLRGAATQHIERVTADQMGMLATVMNALALGAAFHARGVDALVLSAIPAGQLAEPYGAWKARSALDAGRPVILAGGTGNPLFTTDTCASLRAIEIQAGLLLKGTKVDGVYTSDPKTDPTAKRLDQLTFTQALDQGIEVMDRSAFSMCRDHSMRIRVFDMTQPGNIQRALIQQDLGSEVTKGD